MKPHLVGLSGYAQVGKSSVGQILADDYGYESRAFADRLRDLAVEIDPLLDTEGVHGERDDLYWSRLMQLYGYEYAKQSFPAVRDFLVALGAGCRKVLGPDVWVDALLPTHTTYQSVIPQLNVPAVPTVITDVRYANEALRIKQLGGQVWHVEREGVGPANEEEARSIALLPRADRYIHNNGSLLKLEEEVERALHAD